MDVALRRAVCGSRFGWLATASFRKTCSADVQPQAARLDGRAPRNLRHAQGGLTITSK